MAVRPGARRAIGIAFAASFVVGAICVAQAQGPVPSNSEDGFTVLPDPDRTVDIQKGFSMEILVARPFKRVEIADPEVVDVSNPTTDTSISFVAKEVGKTNVNIVDDQQKRISSFVVNVIAQTPAHRPVEVHNQSVLASSTNYACNAAGCEYLSETTSKQQALPRGYSTSEQSNTNTNINSTVDRPPSAAK
jgi:hypothetical protein